MLLQPTSEWQDSLPAEHDPDVWPHPLPTRGGRTTSRQKFLNVLAKFFGVFLVVIFEASIVVQIFISKPTSRLASIDDIMSCRISAEQICVPTGGGSVKFWNENIQTRDCVQGKQPVFVNSFDEGFESVLNGTCEFFYASGGVTGATTRGRYCGQLAVVGEPFFDILTAFTLPKGSALTAPMSNATLFLRERNLLETVENRNSDIICPGMYCIYFPLLTS